MNTHRLDKDTDLLKLTGSAFGTQADANMKGYLRLPISVPDGILPNTSWLLLLELTGKNHGLLPFEIAGDVVLGRGMEGDDAPDLDLTALNAYEMGVSRRHAMLRPTTNHLYLIDLGSTNGCTVNGLPTGKGAVALRRHDHITLGQLNMRVLTLERVLGTNDAAKVDQTAPPPAPSVIELPPAPKEPVTLSPTPPIEKRMPLTQSADSTHPLPQSVEAPAAVEKPAEAAKPTEEAKPEVEVKVADEQATAVTAALKPSVTADPEKPLIDLDQIKVETAASETEKPQSAI